MQIWYAYLRYANVVYKRRSLCPETSITGENTKKKQNTKTKNKTGMLQMECKWSRPTDCSSFISLSAKNKKQYYGIDLPKKRVSGERQMHVYDSQYSEMLKPLSFTRTICRGGGGLCNTLSSTYIPNRKKKGKPKRENFRFPYLKKIVFYFTSTTVIWNQYGNVKKVN